MSAYVIATRRIRADNSYRTRYYADCIDGRPRFVERMESTRLAREDADAIAAQLRALCPTLAFLVIPADERPPRSWDAWGGQRSAPMPLRQMKIE